jgi:hypothetical protein
MSQVTGSKTVGTSPVQLIAASTKINSNVTLYADATDGFPIPVNTSLTLSPAQVAGDLSNVYAVAGTTGQKVHFIGS